MCSVGQVQLFSILRTLVNQAPLSVGFSRQEYWSGLPFPPLGDLPDPGIEPVSPACKQILYFTTETLEKPLNKQCNSLMVLISPKFLLLDSHGIAVLSHGFTVRYKQAS